MIRPRQHDTQGGSRQPPDRRSARLDPGPFEWDLKRLAASVTIAGRENELTGKQIRSAARSAVRSYRETLQQTTGYSPLDLHYFRIEVDSLVAQMGQCRLLIS